MEQPIRREAREMTIQSKMKFMTWPSVRMLAVLVLALCGVAGWAVAQEMAAHDRIFVVTHVDIVPTDAAAGTKLVQQYVIDSRKDKGLVRIEAGAQISRTNHIILVEVWQNQKALDEHIAAAHTREFRKQIDPTLGSPYDERLHLNLE
jgi:quinol monooxygenase YgiN